MAVHYAPEAKTARMKAVCDLLVGGSLDLLSGGKLIARIGLPASCVTVQGDTLSAEPQEGTFALIKGRTDGARICDASGTPIITGFTVGKSNADVVLDYIDLEPKQIVTITSMVIKHA